MAERVDVLDRLHLGREGLVLERGRVGRLALALAGGGLGHLGRDGGLFGLDVSCVVRADTLRGDGGVIARPLVGGGAPIVAGGSNCYFLGVAVLSILESYLGGVDRLAGLGAGGRSNSRFDLAVSYLLRELGSAIVCGERCCRSGVASLIAASPSPCGLAIRTLNRLVCRGIRRITNHSSDLRVPRCKFIPVIRRSRFGGRAARVSRCLAVLELGALELGAALVDELDGVFVHGRIELGRIGCLASNGDDCGRPRVVERVGVLRRRGLSRRIARVARRDAILELLGLERLAITVDPGHVVFVHGERIGCRIDGIRRHVGDLGSPAGERVGVLGRGGLGRIGGLGDVCGFRAVVVIGRLLQDRAVLVDEGDLVFVDDPLGVEGRVGAQCHGGTVVVRHAAAVGCGVPAGEGVAGAGEGVGVQRGRDTLVNRLGGHLALAAVGIERHDDLRVLGPHGVEGNHAAILGGQVLDLRLVRIGGAGPVGCRVPASEGVVCLHERIRRERLRHVVGVGLIEHGPGGRCVVLVELHRVGVGGPLRVDRRVARHRSVEIVCRGQALDSIPAAEGVTVGDRVGGLSCLLAVFDGLVDRSRAMGGAEGHGVLVHGGAIGGREGGVFCYGTELGIPAGKCVRILGGRGLGGIIAIIRRPCAVANCAALQHGDAVLVHERVGAHAFGPGGRVLTVARGALGDGDFHGRLVQVSTVPAAEGVAGPNRIVEDDVLGLDGVARRVGDALGQCAVVEVVSDGVGDHIPLGVERSILDQDYGIPIGVDDLTLGARRPASELVTSACEGVLVERCGDILVDDLVSHSPFTAVSIERNGHLRILRPLGIQGNLAVVHGC